MENNDTLDVTKVDMECVNCGTLKAEIASKDEMLKQYEAAYSELVTRYNKLWALYNAVVEHTLATK